MKKVIEFDGLLVKLGNVDFVGDVEFKNNLGTGNYGFNIVVNGSKARIGATNTKDEALKLWKEFKEMVIKANERNDD